MKNPRILFFEAGSSTGGAFKSLYELISELSNREISTSLVFYEGCIKEDSLIERLNRKKCRTFELEITNKITNRILMKNYLIRGVWYFTNVVFPSTIFIFHIIKRYKIQIIHCNNDIYGNIPGIIAGKIAQIKVIQHIRNIRPLTKIERMFLKYIDVIILPSKYGKRYYGFSSAYVIPNPVREYDITQIEKKAAVLRNEYPSDAPILLYAGSIRKEKGIEVLIDALKILNRKLTLLIIGSSYPGEEDLLKNLKNCKIPKVNLFVHDYVENIEVYYKLSDLVVYPSLIEEGFGRVVAECISLGVQVLCSDLNSLIENFGNYPSVCFFKMGSSRDLAEKIEKILNHPKNFPHLDDFSSKRYVDKVLDLYTSLLKI